MEQQGMTTGRGKLPIAGIETENLSIELTTRCTNECSHCFARAGRINSPELSFDAAQEIVGEGLSIGFRHLHLTGGEPLLWPRLISLLERAVTSGYETVFINTNGALLVPEMARRLAGFGDRLFLSISLQGPEDVHDRFRGEGSYQKALQGVRNALDAGLQVIVFAVAGRSLAAVLPRFAEFVFMELQGVRELTLIQLIRVEGDADDPVEELLSPDDFARLVRSVALLNLYGYRTSVLENPLAGVAAGLMGMPWLPPGEALLRSGKIVVMADRSITLSHSSRESYGVYSPGALAGVLASDEYAAAVSPDTKTCPACRFHSACMEKGMLRPSEWFRDMEESVPYCKRVLGLLE
jgi:MoaA/NifB/PqqE/SkfB family radical SAM enzyme